MGSLSKEAEILFCQSPKSVVNGRPLELESSLIENGKT